jgi:16S rRNA (cytidine1402-2'-O)-methyltransferase
VHQEIIVTRTPGRLDVVATPIGNLADLSARARAALEAADLVAAEDTRHTGTLLTACGISRPLVSLHDYNERARVAGLIEQLQSGKVVALVSDAGTPLVSDPGYTLVRAAAAAGIEVRAIPGPSALTAALSIAGLPTDRFAFEGFLPATAAARRRALAELAHDPRTLVFFEAPHRIVEVLTDMVTAFSAERPAVIARELTKTYESIYRGTLGSLLQRATGDANVQRGELVLIVGGAPAQDAMGDQQLLVRMMPLLAAELPPARAAAIAAKLTGVTRDAAYQAALACTGKSG